MERREGNVGSLNTEETPQGSGGTTSSVSGEQPNEYASMSREDLLDRLKKAEKSYNEYRSFTDRKLQEISSKYKQLETAIKTMKPTETQYNEAQQYGDLLPQLNTSVIPDDVLAKLRALHKKDPVLANIAIVGAAMNSMKGSDPVIQKIKEQQLIKDGVSKLGDPIAESHADEIREIMYEYNMNPEHEASAKAAFEIWKGRNVDTYKKEAVQATNTVAKGENIMDSHNESVQRNVEQGVQLSETERKMADIATSRGVFKDINEFQSFKKMIDSIPKTSDGKYLGVRIDDIPQKEPNNQNR